jgi:diguanylate cyclase (GGDEF)-like protein
MSQAVAGDSRLRDLGAVARKLSALTDFEEIIEFAADRALAALNAASASISRQEPGTGTIRTLINSGLLGPDEHRWPDDEIYQVDRFVFGSIWAGVAESFAVGQLRIVVVSVDDSCADPEEIRQLRALHKATSISAPLIVDGKMWGEFYATREHGAAPFDSTDEAIADVFSGILSSAVSRATHIDSLTRMAYLDPLTGLANRRALDDAATIAFDPTSASSRRPLTAVTFDVNGLKGVNDTQGHAAGDKLLTQIGTLLDTHYAGLHGSLVARVGGDEFTVFVPVHSPTAVVAAAERACYAATNLPDGGGLSCGVATTTDRVANTASMLFAAADAAQYQAKRTGRTQPVTAAYPYAYQAADGRPLPVLTEPAI